MVNKRSIDMIAYTYKEHGKFELTDKPKPEIIETP